MALAPQARNPRTNSDAVAARYLRRFPRGRHAAAAAGRRGEHHATRLSLRGLRLPALCALFVLAGALEWMQAIFTFLGSDRLRWFHQDFPALYAAGTLVLDGAGRSLYDTSAIAAAELAAAGAPVGDTGVLAYFNPPFFALLLSPLARLPLRQAYEVWTGLSLLLLVGVCAMTWHLASPLPARLRVLIVLGLLTLFPLTYGLQLGQFSMILVFCWGSAFVLLRRGCPALAGVALAPLLIKPELLIPVAVVLVWKRQWRVFITLCPLTLAAVAASLWVVGGQNALDYPLYLLHSTTWEGKGVATEAMFNWSGIVAMRWDLSDDSRIALVLVTLLTLLTAAGIAWRWRGPLAASTNAFAWQWAALTVATILVDPHLYLQDTIIVVPAAVALIAVAPPHLRAPTAAAALMGWALMALGIFPNGHLGVNAFGLYLAAALGVLTLGLRTRDAPSFERAAVS